MPKQYRELTPEQAQHFLDKGYVAIEGAFPHDVAKHYTDLAWKRLGYDPNDPTTWKESKIHMPSMHHFNIWEFAPRAWDALCDLVGGEERVKRENAQWGDGFILNLNYGADKPYQPPSPISSGIFSTALNKDCSRW
jgi:hypothetical protein